MEMKTLLCTEQLKTARIWEKTRKRLLRLGSWQLWCGWSTGTFYRLLTSWVIVALCRRWRTHVERHVRGTEPEDDKWAEIIINLEERGRDNLARSSKLQKTTAGEGVGWAASVFARRRHFPKAGKLASVVRSRRRASGGGKLSRCPPSGNASRESPRSASAGT